MLQLLRIEWLKIKNYRAFWIFSIFYLASIYLLNYITWTIHRRTTQEMPGSSTILGTPFSFPDVWGTVGFLNSWLLYLPGMMLILLMTNEFNFKTHRQNVIDGWSRNTFITVKLVLALLLAFIITLINVATGLYFGSISPGSFTVEGMEKILYIFLQSVAYLFFAQMLAVLFRRSGLAIIVFFLYGIIFEWVITAMLTFNLQWAPVGYFLPLEISDVLLPFPFGKRLFYPKAPAPGVLAVVTCLYISIFAFISRRKFLKDDL